MQSRRLFIQQTSLMGAGLAMMTPFASFGHQKAPARRKFTLTLDGGSIGVKAPFPDMMDLAQKYGFESITPDTNYLSGLSQEEVASLLSAMKQKELVWASAGLPFDFRKDEATHREGLKKLPRAAKVLQAVGVTRMGTWILPFHKELTYLENFALHRDRIGAIADILKDHNIRFGLEYVGPKTSWTSMRHPFLHSLRETRELIDAIGQPNVGVVLDTYHWHNALENEDDLLSLTNEDIVACDLNDASRDLPLEQLKDLERELPMATGVIDTKTFLNALVKIGYDGPVRAEPFSKALNQMAQDEAVKTTAEAMKKAFALID